MQTGELMVPSIANTYTIEILQYVSMIVKIGTLYSYSNSERDMGNSKDYNQFFSHFAKLIQDLYRVVIPGRIVVVHCMDLPSMKERDGVIGVKDFSGDIIRAFQAESFVYHSRTLVWKDPLIEATRTN